MSSFYPISTNENSNDFDWNIIAGLFLSDLYGLNFTERKSSEIKQELEKFEQKCESELSFLLVVMMLVSILSKFTLVIKIFQKFHRN